MRRIAVAHILIPPALLLGSIEPGGAQVFNRTASERIHDQTLRQGVQQRNAARSSSPGLGGASSSESPSCLSPAESRLACARLREIVEGRSKATNRRGAIEEIVLQTPASGCGGSIGSYGAQLSQWGGACGFSSGEMAILRNPEDAPSASTRSSASPPASPSRPAAAERPPARAFVASASAREHWAAYSQRHARLTEEYAKEEGDLRDRVRRLAAEAKDAIKQAKKYSPEDLKARARCASGDAKACLLAERFVRSLDDYIALVRDHCRLSHGMCSWLAIAGRTAKRWDAHREGLESWVKGIPSSGALFGPGAILARFHLNSPEWPAAWAWSDRGRDPALGRELAQRSCAEDVIVPHDDRACPELLLATREGLGGAKGESDAERRVLDAACDRGYLPESACAERARR